MSRKSDANRMEAEILSRELEELIERMYQPPFDMSHKITSRQLVKRIAELGFACGLKIKLRILKDSFRTDVTVTLIPK